MSSRIFADIEKNRLYICLGFIRGSDVSSLLYSLKKGVKLLRPNFTVLFDLNSFVLGKGVDISLSEKIGYFLFESQVGAVARVSRKNILPRVVEKFTKKFAYQTFQFSTIKDAEEALDEYQKNKP